MYFQPSSPKLPSYEGVPLWLGARRRPRRGALVHGLCSTDSSLIINLLLPLPRTTTNLGLQTTHFVILQFRWPEVQNGSRWAKTRVSGSSVLLLEALREGSASLPSPTSRAGHVPWLTAPSILSRGKSHQVFSHLSLL